VIMRPRLQLGCRRRSFWRRNGRAGALVGLVLALLVVGDLPVVHDHDAPGLYNEECPLARLAITSPRASVSQDPDPFLFACTPDAVLAAPRVILAPFSPASFAPRAPPAKLLLPSRAVVG
jgi:hypothetical protein